MHNNCDSLFIMEDKRKYKRFTVEGIDGNVNFSVDVEIINISAGGVALKSQRRLEVDREYTLKLKNGGKALTLRGLVVWSILSESRKGPHKEVIPFYRVGMQFKDVMSEKMAELVNFIEEHKNVKNHRLSGIRFNIRSPEKAVLNFPLSYKVKKISLGGMLIETMQSFELEDRVPMDIYLPGGKTAMFYGRIASCLPTPHATTMLYDVGIEFLEMSEESRAIIKEFIESIEKN